MSLAVVVAIAVLLAAVVAVVSAPLRARPAPDLDASGPSAAPGPVADRGPALGSPAPAVSGPGPRPNGTAANGGGREGELRELRAELEASREAKYREIRDAELDYRTGKLSEADYGALDAGLRAEAAEILRQLDLVRPG